MPLHAVEYPVSYAFAEGLLQLGNVADQDALDAEKAANNRLFWEGVQEAFKGQDEAYKTCTLQMMRFSVNAITSTSRNISSWLEKTLLDVEEFKCPIQGCAKSLHNDGHPLINL